MNTTLKILIAFLAGALLICVIAGVAGFLVFRSAGSAVSDLVRTDPGQFVREGTENYTYDLPEGFADVFSVDLAGYQLTGYTGSDGHSHIYFLQLPPDVVVDVADMESELEKILPTGAKPYSNVQVVDSKPGRIAGQDVTLVTSEGTNRDGDNFREVSTVFQGGDGQIVVVFSRPTASWDQAEVDDFLASIR